MNRSLKLSVLLALALGSTQAAAVQLGQVQVKSALGQPLLAEIPVTPSHPGELSTLHAQLAASEDYDRAGISDGRPSVDLKFGLANEGGHRILRITSAQPVNDPYLDLLVEVTTGAGKSVREVTILLDPPGSYAAPAAQAPAPAQRARPASRATAPAPAPAPAAKAASPAGEGSYSVERGDTLSEIAQGHAPAGVDTNQMLLALKQANPDAFYRDNINALKSGAVLRIPTAQQAQAMSVAEAMAEVRRQNGEWSANAVGAPTAVANAATGPGSASAPAGAGKPSDRLALVPPQAGGSGNGTVGNDKASSKLRQDLLRSQESLTALQQQSNELKSRLHDLEDINGKNQRLLSLKDSEIAELQHKLAEARKAANLPPAPAAAAAPAAQAPAKPPVAAVTTPGGAAHPAGAATSPALTAPARAASAKPSVAPAKAPAKPKSKPAPVKAAPRPVPAASPWYMQPWVWEAAAGGVVVLLLLALLARRRKSVPATPAPASSLADRFGAVAASEPAASEDPDQDELLDQLAEHPDDIGLHLELVSLYYSRRDVEHFEAAAEAMHAHIVDPQQDEWLDVVAMGEDLVPGHPLFGGAGEVEGRSDFEDEDAQHFEEAPEADGTHEPFEGLDIERESVADMDTAPFGSPDFAESPADDSAPPMPPLPAQKKVSEYHFDFNLTPQARQGDAHEPARDEVGPEDEQMPWAEADDSDVTRIAPVAAPEASSSWNFEEPVEDEGESVGTAQTAYSGEFSDDPIDTKLDLARAYLDMGDADGARAMLEEVMSEGSQTQKDAASSLLDSIR